jgi:protein-S-isoprenylcysteine O-methyltransferase Ste14
MVIWLSVGLAIVGPLAYWGRKRVLKEHRQADGLSVSTVIAIWLVYGGHLALTVVAAIWRLWPLPVNDGIGHGIALTIGYSLCGIGVLLFVLGMAAFGSFQRMNGRTHNRLVTGGIYRWSRNPQNVGWALFLLGVSIAGESGFALLLTAVFWTRFVSYIPEEERQLKGYFGEEYSKYLEQSHRYFGQPRHGSRGP